MTTFETNALEINDLNKNYPGFSLNHLNLTLPSGFWEETALLLLLS